MYTLKFLNPVEIRMGSPFNVVDVVLSGGYVPNLKGSDFQDKGCVSATRDSVLLVEWVLKGGEPGFIIWLISAKKTVKKSERISGCCDDIRFVSAASAELSIVENNLIRKLIVQF